MALVAYLDWEVRTTGHDLNCSGFNPARDPTNGVDYTQQDDAEITSMAWYVDASNNTWIRSTELTNWVNSGKTLASLKGNHIHLAGMAIAGGVLFDWVASTGKPGAYYLQAKGGGNPSWTTKPTRVWLNQVYTPENTSLPSGSNTWAWGDWDSLGYNTIYVRFGAESDADPDSKDQDDVIADGKTWTRGAYEIIDVGTDGSGPYLVLDRSPAAVSSQDGYGRIGGAMASPGGVESCGAASPNSIVRTGTYVIQYNVVQVPNGWPKSTVVGAIPGDKYNEFSEANYPVFNVNTVGVPNYLGTFCHCKINDTATTTSWGAVSISLYYSIVTNWKRANPGFYAFASRLENCYGLTGTVVFSYIKNSSVDYGRISGYYSVFHGQTSSDVRANFGTYYGGGVVVNCVMYDSLSSGFGSNYDPRYFGVWESCVAINCAGYGFRFGFWSYSAECDRRQRIRRCFYYNCTLGATNSQLGGADNITLLPGNPFRDPANGDFRLADNEAGRMLKQAGFQIPGPQGAPPMKFDAGAVQNSFYDIASGGGVVINRPMLFGT